MVLRWYEDALPHDKPKTMRECYALGSAIMRTATAADGVLAEAVNPFKIDGAGSISARSRARTEVIDDHDLQVITSTIRPEWWAMVAPVTVKARGPVPKWCSASCRQRAWEASRAAASGTAAVRVVDREVLAVPGDAAGWVEQLGLLARHLGQGPAVVADHDLDAVVQALDLTREALAWRVRWRGRSEPWE